jgi:segregation and condensation protein B
LLKLLWFAAMSQDPSSSESPKESPLSLSRLREAFAAMLGGDTPRSGQSQASREQPTENLAPRSSLLAPCEINPRSVIESLLFVGRPENGSYSPRELAAAMRGVSPAEIDAAVVELNAVYDADGTPYVIEGTVVGYRLVLRPEFERMRDKFYGTVREAKLSPAALEVLAIIAYNQPVTAERINELRNAPNGAAIATLVRRKLVSMDRHSEVGTKPAYATTDRFLKLFDLESVEALPRSEELAAA